MEFERATHCKLDGNDISLEEALRFRAEAEEKGVDQPDFRCIGCDKPVRPFGGDQNEPHFEHHERNGDCVHSVAYMEKLRDARKAAK
ncbi:MAG: hypothetical protein Q7R40_02905 [Phaeospirillum sp.]|nr:hypothetical protein [Phaeospirillum sp.]